MREFKIGDTVKVIRRDYPHYDEFGCIIDFHNGNAVVHFPMCRPVDTKEYPIASLEGTVPPSWINRDYTSYFKSMDGVRTGIDEMAINMKKEDSLKIVPSSWINGARTGIDEMALNMKKYLDIAFDRLADIPQFRTSNLIKRVVFSDRKTIILWNDGSKTMVSCAEGEQLDPYMGFCAAFTKGFFGSKHQVEKMVKNADYQPSKKTKKKISEVLKQLREDDTENEDLPEFLKKKLVSNNTEASEFLIGKKVKNTKSGSAYENCTGEITHKDESGTLIATIKISNGTIELPFKPCDFTFVENE